MRRRSAPRQHPCCGRGPDVILTTYVLSPLDQRIRVLSHHALTNGVKAWCSGRVTRAPRRARGESFAAGAGRERVDPGSDPVVPGEWRVPTPRTGVEHLAGRGGSMRRDRGAHC